MVISVKQSKSYTKNDESKDKIFFATLGRGFDLVLCMAALRTLDTDAGTDFSDCQWYCHYWIAAG